MLRKIKILEIFWMSCIATAMILPVSCMNDLLNQQPSDQLSSELFWKTENDALFALYGAYADIRPCFDRDYNLEGHGEFFRTGSITPTAGVGLSMGEAYVGGSYGPSGYGSSFDGMYQYLYGGVNRANYVIDNVRDMVQRESNDDLRRRLESIIGEARLLRGLCYFKLISMWGDVPGIWQTVYDDSEVSSLSRSPIAEVKDSIYADFTYAFDKLPASSVGRAAKPAALALRGKLQLYWACWNNFGWPELNGFAPSASVAQQAYAAAAADFKSVIDDFGLTLFRNGEPGECDDLGKAEKLPNYFYLFLPTANDDPEILFAFAHGGTGSNQSEELMRDFGCRNQESSQGRVGPWFEIADRYQSTITGDFCPPLVQKNRTTDPDYFTTENSSLNPQSYENRDYRMKSTIIWDYETIVGMTGLVETGWYPFVFGSLSVLVTASNIGDFPGFTADNIGQYTANQDANRTGYCFRKFVRNYAGQGRAAGDFNWPVIRLADVYLMYAEAINEANGGPDAKAIELVNKVRHRGNLPPLAPEKTATKADFFNAVEQERIVELIGEGQRGFDLRRWRAIERVWCGPRDPNGVWRTDTWGRQVSRYFLNSNDLVYQQCYIFRIPPSERERNPNLSQNTPYL